jgi:hypothetical protein
MKLPIESSSLDFLAVSAAEPVIDFDSKQPRVDADGKAVFALSVVAVGGEGADILVVKVAGEPKGISLGAQVKLTGLVATTWQMGDRHGMSFRAERVEVLPTAKATVGA